MTLSFEIAHFSEKGNHRRHNQDLAFNHEFSHAQLFGVVDGIGGMQKGQEGARVVRDAIINFAKTAKKDDISVSKALVAAHEEVKAYSYEIFSNPYQIGVCATLALVTENQIVVGHVGDCPGLLIEGNSSKLTTNYGYNSGGTLKGAALGVQLDISPTVEEWKTTDRSKLVLMTDGVSGCMSINEIIDTINCYQPVETVISKLKLGLMSRDPKDNFTLALGAKR